MRRPVLQAHAKAGQAGLQPVARPLRSRPSRIRGVLSFRQIPRHQL